MNGKVMIITGLIRASKSFKTGKYDVKLKLKPAIGQKLALNQVKI